jgi:anti-sigma regulatory factor (Ser/Thr protein kinase)
MTTILTADDVGAGLFRHDALFYAGDDEYVAHTTGFISDGVDAGEAVLVAVPPRELSLIRSALPRRTAAAVGFSDMTQVGRNPLRIMPMWRDFVNEHGSEARPVRGIGQPIWPERTPDELVEAQRHESLINLAFDGAQAWILCPYDLASLDGSVVAEAHRSHPNLIYNGTAFASPDYRGLPSIDKPFDEPLPEPATRPETMDFRTANDLHEIRQFTSRWGTSFGLPRAKLAELVLTVNELVTNSLRHAGTAGTVRAWKEGASLVVEVRDGGHIDEPLIGRIRPAMSADGGFGLWIVNQLCDLVEIRSLPGGSVVRLHVRTSSS